MNNLPIQIDLNESFFQEEIRCEHTVPAWMKRVWAVELDLVDQFQQFCEKYDIPYFAIGGTLLGAARHEGFIPWDDDIDLAVPREDYDRLCRLAPDFFQPPYFFQTEQTDSGFSRAFARLRNSETTAMPLYDAESRLKYNQGIWIDIFPLDNIPDHKEQKEPWIRKLSELHNKIWNLDRMSLRYRGKLEHDSMLKKTRYVVGPILKLLMERFHISNTYYRQYEELVGKYSGKPAEEWGLLWFYDEREKTVWKKECFAETRELPFENLTIRVPVRYDEVLTKQYGSWNVFVKGGAVHFDTVFDTDTSYVYYSHHPEALKEQARIQKHGEGNC